jgi:hypothetical protein
VGVGVGEGASALSDGGVGAADARRARWPASTTAWLELTGGEAATAAVVPPRTRTPTPTVAIAPKRRDGVE